MCGFYCIVFLEYMLAGKSFLGHTNLLSPNDHKNNNKIIYNFLKIYMVEDASFEFILREIDDTRNFLLDEIKHSDLMSEKKKKTYNYLYFVERLPILASTVIDYVSISEFA